MEHPLLLAALALPLSTAYVGYRRGRRSRRALAGFVLGLLLGPIGLVPFDLRATETRI